MNLAMTSSFRVIGAQITKAPRREASGPCGDRASTRDRLHPSRLQPLWLASPDDASSAGLRSGVISQSAHLDSLLYGNDHTPYASEVKPKCGGRKREWRGRTPILQILRPIRPYSTLADVGRRGFPLATIHRVCTLMAIGWAMESNGEPDVFTHWGAVTK